MTRPVGRGRTSAGRAAGRFAPRQLACPPPRRVRRADVFRSRAPVGKTSAQRTLREPLRSRHPVFEKLQADYQRFREVEAALLDPGVAVDPSRLASLAKERGTLAKLALPYGRYLELGHAIAEAE